MITTVTESKRVEALFGDWQETMIWSCLQGIMGSMYADDSDNPKSVIAVLGDFCFCAGEPDKELLVFLEKIDARDFIIIIPQNEKWGKLIESCYGNRTERITRYALKKEKDVFVREKLEAVAESLPMGYEMKLIDESIYQLCRKERWSRDLVSQYADYATYKELGIGVAILDNGNLAAGASSYTRYKDGIEIEIDTKSEHRRKGLASAAGARLILECLDRGLYPSWDAENMWSVGLAEKLGYHFDYEYPAYKCFFGKDDDTQMSC